MNTTKKISSSSPRIEHAPGFRSPVIIPGRSRYHGLTFAVGSDDSRMHVQVRIYGAEKRTPDGGPSEADARRVESALFRLCAHLVELEINPSIGADWHAGEARNGHNVASLAYEIANSEELEHYAGVKDKIAAAVINFAVGA